MRKWMDFRSLDLFATAQARSRTKCRGRIHRLGANESRCGRRIAFGVAMLAFADSAPAGQSFGFIDDSLASDDYIFVDSFETRDCSLPPSCPVPASGKSCIAGRLTDGATRQPLQATFNVGLTCGNGAIGGPCDLAIAAYDTAAYAANPGTSTPLASGEILVDGCGRFHISDLTPPGSGSVAVVSADAPGGGGHVPAATLRPLAANQQLTGLEAAVVTGATVASWSFLGQVDFSLGAILLNYGTGGAPTAGVTAIRVGGAGSETYRYFSDTDTQRLFVDPASTATGANGSVLIANGSFASYSGVGGESNGCHWTNVIATSLAGIVVVAEVACVQ